MKNFFIKTLILMAVFCFSAVAYACDFCISYNYYMFSVINRSEFVAQDNVGFVKFWKSYTNGVATQSDVEKLGTMGYENFKKLLAGEKNFNGYENCKSPIIETALKKNDSEMIEYLNLLGQYLYSAVYYDEWRYPSKEEIAKSKKAAQDIVSQALKYQGQNLKERYALLVMRCYFRQGNYISAINYWNTTASKITDNGCKNAIKGLYAGCLFKTGKVEQAAEMFAQLGDMLSVKYCLKNKRNLSGITKIYQDNPTSPSLIYLVQDFVNNTQETIDTVGFQKEIVDYHPIYRKEVLDFAKKANDIVAENKTDCPQLWKTAAAMTHYLVNFQQDAEKEINQALSLKGTTRMNDNARAIKLLIMTKTDGNLDENYVLSELKWLESKIEDEQKLDRTTFNHYFEALQRVVYLGLIPRYEKKGDKETALLLYCYMDKVLGIGVGNPDFYYEDFFTVLINNSADETIKLANFIQKGQKNALQKYLVGFAKYSENFFNDIIGTMYLREDNIAKAVDYLKLVPLSFVSNQHIAPYMALRNYTQENWFKYQPVTYTQENDEYLGKGISENKKLTFANEILSLKNRYSKAKGEERKKIAYDLAVRYFQASRLGNCWFLTNYSWSIYETEPQYKNEKDFAKIAINYLEESATSTNADLQEKSLCGLSYIPVGKMLNCYYDEKRNWKYVCDVDKNSRQYQAAKRLKTFITTHKSKYLGKCDILDNVN